MANALNTGSFTGLATQSYTIPVAGMYTIKGTLTLPEIGEGSSADSQALVTVNQNGSPIYTGQAGAKGFLVEATCALNDVSAIVVSSSAAVDQPINSIRTTYQIN